MRNEQTYIRKSCFSKFIILTFFLVITSTIYSQTPPIIYVAGDGTGDYNCDGISDQIQINQALDYISENSNYTTVFLKGEFTYIIDQPVLISSNTIFTGDSTTILKLMDTAVWWTKNKPLISQKNATGWHYLGVEGDSISNVEIFGFEINGGKQEEPTGKAYVPLIHFRFPYNISIHDMKLTDSRWDIVRLSAPESTSTYSNIYNNIIKRSGHEGICYVGLTNFEVYNNDIFSTRTNTGIRLKNTDEFSVHNNVIGNSLGDNSSGYAGILIENPHFELVGEAEIFENLIYGKNGGIHLGTELNPSIYPIDSRKDVHIHHNKIFKTRYKNDGGGFDLDGGIKINGYQNTIIEHNVIESGTTDGIVYEGTLGGSSGYHTLVRNNIIINNGGFGINNKESAVHTFDANNNLVYNNDSGNYNNTISTDDINSAPLYASTHSTLNKWHHIVGSYDNETETFKIYVDGIERASEKNEGFGTIASNSHNLFLGGYKAIAHWFEGRHDEMAIWNRALSSNEVFQLFNNGTPENIQGALTTDLQAYYKMENNWNDSSGNAYHAEDSTASFTTDAINGTHAGLYDGIGDGVQYPTTLSTTNGITISVWTYRTGTNEEFQTILAKGSQDNNDHIWLYFRKESVELELGNGIERYSLEANVINPEDLDFHVKSQTGRWNGVAWVQDTVMSPCIDSGDSTTGYYNELQPNGERVNIGVYGNTNEASNSETNSYYVSTSGNDSNTGTEAQPWKTVAKVNNEMNNFIAGDNILFKRGDIWNGEYLSSTSHPSGTINIPIVYSAYGTGAKPILNIHTNQTPTWIDENNNIWSTTIGAGSRFFKDDIEMLRAADLSYLGLYGTGYHTEFINGGNNQKLSIYSMVDPGTYIFSWSPDSTVIALYDADYINFDNIDFQGGASSSIRIYDNKGWKIINCTSGKNAAKAIKVKNSTQILIDSCHFDANNTINQLHLPPDILGSSYSGCDDGIFVTTGSSYIAIKNNFFKNWGHASFSANTDDVSNIISHISFHDNELTSPDILYGGRITYSGYSEDGEYYNNYIHDISVQNQLGGSRNHFHHNIIDGVLDSPLKSDKIGVGIILSNYNVQIKDNIIEHNVIANTESEGILIYSINFDFPGELSGNIIRNNIIYNCGLTLGDVAIQFHEDSIGQNIFNNIIENNSIFNDSTTQTCRYLYNGTVSETSIFNNQNTNIKDNIASNPMFIDAPNNDYHLISNSPCINAGTDALSIEDYVGTPIPLLAAPDIGAYEFGLYWNGNISNDWHTNGNWSNNQIPTASDSITIPSSLYYKNYPKVSNNVQIKKLYLNGNDKMIIGNNVNFDVIE